MVASAVHLTEAISESKNQPLRFDFMMFFIFSISTIMILFYSKMDQLQLHFRLLKVLSSLSVTPNLSDYAWQPNYVILYDEYCYFAWFTSFSLSQPFNTHDLISSYQLNFVLQKIYLNSNKDIALCYSVQKVCPRPFSSRDHPFPKTQIVTEGTLAIIPTDCEV